MGRRAFAVHRWLGAVIGVQLFLWSLGGFMFALHDIDWVRGERGQKKAAPPPIAWDRVKLTAAQAVERVGDKGAHKVDVRMWLDRPVFQIVTKSGVHLVDAESGQVLSPIKQKAAEKIARQDRAKPPGVRKSTLITKHAPSEFRGRDLPAWRIELDDADNSHIYVDTMSGRITARRNDAWRRFDFFWMLHTMDYQGRDDFNHPLLIIVAGLGLVTVSSGAFLWALRIRRRWRKRVQSESHLRR